MTPRAIRIAAVVLLVSATRSAAGAPAGAPCCAAPSEPRMTAPACCGCEGSLARPVAADRSAVEPRITPLAAPVAASSALGAPAPWNPAAVCGLFVPVRVVPSPPFPRRL